MMHTAEVIIRLRGVGPDGRGQLVELPIASDLTYEQIWRVAHSRSDGGVPDLENACCDEKLHGYACRLREAEDRLIALVHAANSTDPTKPFTL